MRARRPSITAIACVGALALSVLAVPAAGQTARSAPAIGPWLGAPRGSISAVRALDGAVAVEAIVRDPDSPRSVQYEFLVDGRSQVRGRTERPTDFGAEIRIEEQIAVDAGVRSVCLRLIDDRFGNRTVDCVDATSAPPDMTSPELRAQNTGVVVAPTGVVLPVIGGRSGNWRVTTPCGASVRLGEGTYVDRARVVVDAGHGGTESGAWGGQITEKNLNLEVAELVVERFRELGITAQITRTYDYRLPIRTRAEIATALAPDVFISVHHNGGATRPSSRPGTEVFYGVDKPESRRLASIVYEEMVAALTPFDIAWVSTVSEGASLRLRDDGMDLYGIHRYSPDVNSVITEFVYLSNPPESQLMQRDGLPELEAETIVDSVMRWWWTNDTGTTRGRRFTDSSSSGTGGFEGCVDPPLIVPQVAQLAEDQPEDETGGGFLLLPALYLNADPALA